MKNACVALINTKNTNSISGVSMLLNSFLSFGYSCEEIRFIDEKHITSFGETVSELLKDYDNLLLITAKEILVTAQNIIMDECSGTFMQSTTSGAGVLTQKDRTAFLLSMTDEELGVQFISNVCVPYLTQKYGIRYEKITLKTIGASFLKINELLKLAKEMSGDKLSFNHFRLFDEDKIEIVYDNATSKMLTDDILRLFAEGLEGQLYALNDSTIEQNLVDLLKLRGMKISVAESFTGGGVGRRIVSVSGASEVYFEGLNTYNELSKKKRLGVREYSLKTYGAVSDQTVYEMAAGLIAEGDSDITIATTGLAGPKSDNSDFPVGLSYIAIGTKEKVYVYRYKFEGTRQEITEKAINHALFLAYRHLKNI